MFRKGRREGRRPTRTERLEKEAKTKERKRERKGEKKRYEDIARSVERQGRREGMEKRGGKWKSRTEGKEDSGGRRTEGISKCRGGLISILVLFIDVLSQPHSCPLLALSLLYRCAYTYVVANARSPHARASDPAKTVGSSAKNR